MPVVTSVLIDPDQPRRGAATLTRVDDAPTRTWLVQVDSATARQWGLPGQADQLLGEVTRLGRRRWSPVAYNDRNHLLHGCGPVAVLPEARSRGHAAGMLLLHWRTRDTARRQRHCPPKSRERDRR